MYFHTTSIFFILLKLIKCSTVLSKRDLEKLGDKLYCTLPKAGPAFIKLGQFLSTRQDLINPIIASKLSALQDQAPQVEFHKIKKILQSELGKKLGNELIVDETPVAAASVAQVHRGTLLGKNVAVKILRPQIAKSFKKNLSMMRKVVKLVNFFIMPAKRLRLLEVIGVIEDAAKIETNMKLEAAVAEKFRKNLQDNNDVLIPKIYWEYTTKNVLVMEWIDGEKLSNLNEKFDKQKIIKNIAHLSFQQSYIDGFFHADIHPGNILINKNGKVVLLDFGLVSFLPEKDRLFLAEIIYAFSRSDYDKVAELHYDAGYITDKSAVKMFALSCVSVAAPVIGKPISEISMGTLLRNLFEISAEFNMHTQPQLILLQKTMVSLEGTLMVLDSDVNMWELIEPWFKEWAKKHLSIKSIIKRSGEKIFDILENIVQNSSKE